MLNTIISFLILLIPSSFSIQLLRLAFYKNLSEKTTYRLTIGSILCSSIAVILILQKMMISGPYVINNGNWFSDNTNYTFNILWIFDKISLVYAIVTLILAGLISFFSKRYLHKDRGFHRFYLLLTLFSLGLLIVSFSGNMELLIIGWELVGLTSILLISFFSYRPEPPKSALYVFSYYRIGDTCLILAALMIIYFNGAADFTLNTTNHLFTLTTSLYHPAIGILIFIAAAVKAGLYPFSNWLPRAMEGPTPSSAVFYGALSVHLGPLLLLRTYEQIYQNEILNILVLVTGIATVVIGQLCWQVQNDVKSRLAYGSVIQLGFIVCEIALHFENAALFHIVAHASLRTLQILKAPSFLHDHQLITQMTQKQLKNYQSNKSSRLSDIIFRFSLERGYLDLIASYIVAACKKYIQILIKIERFILRVSTGNKTTAN